MRASKNALYRILAILALGVVIYFIFARSEDDNPPGQARDDQAPLRGDPQVEGLDLLLFSWRFLSWLAYGEVWR